MLYMRSRTRNRNDTLCTTKTMRKSAERTKETYGKGGYGLSKKTPLVHHISCTAYQTSHQSVRRLDVDVAAMFPERQIVFQVRTVRRPSFVDSLDKRFNVGTHIRQYTVYTYIHKQRKRQYTRDYKLSTMRCLTVRQISFSEVPM